MYFSNRSAAYLKLGNAKSKALKDAERCVELAPEWSKSYSRLGAAQHALRRFDAAIQTFKVLCAALLRIFSLGRAMAAISLQMPRGTPLFSVFALP